MSLQFLSHACLAGLALALGASLPSSATAQSTKGGHVLGIHLVTLKPGADASAFEGCMAKRAAATNRTVPGLNVYLMKGDRGEHTGQYVIVYELDSVARRDEYFPPGGGVPPKFQDLLNTVPCAEYQLRGVPDHYTDFVVMH